MTTKTKSLIRDFDSLCKKHQLKNVTLNLENTQDQEMIRHVDGETWYHIAPVQWTPLAKPTREKFPVSIAFHNLNQSFVRLNQSSKKTSRSLKRLTKAINNAKQRE